MNQENTMQIANATVLITGANRGIGLAFARGALARGARLVYAAARYDGLEAGLAEVLADETTRQTKQSLASAQAAYLAAS
ncbi:hypothetical protein GCM10027034_31690 [Ramlibacter solisilvae]|uniref:SDR family NAD(P)-dependent oxidoreductase n=1 Tax=Ramlibacter tataouinensis TaxID=94132 RepID=A0A127JS23_9BURK|nr:hypothetical protein UC35_07205 [Ramlibacter tataouinensis]